ncbi:MAG: hypothetical protein JXB62_21450 [Pirellulales bacterium]|nr:hypothetical protein [Pirellulales bacterium]
MKRSVAVRVMPWTILAFLSVVLLNGQGPATGQEKGGAEPPAVEKAKESRGRLPSYYRRVVDEKQREAIYAIQKEYAPKIAALKAQLETLTNERDAKVVAVLTPEQRKEIDDLKAAAKAEREKKKAAAK